jgi:hypothetical protein
VTWKSDGCRAWDFVFSLEVVIGERGSDGCMYLFAQCCSEERMSDQQCLAGGCWDEIFACGARLSGGR